jgi:RIO kinase 1
MSNYISKLIGVCPLLLPELLDTLYAKEIWGLYEDGTLLADSKLTGQFEENLQDVDLEEVIEVIEAAHVEEQERQERLREAEQPE